MSVEKAQSVIARLTDALGPGIVGQSAVGDGLADQLAGRRFTSILEIGTLRGIGAAVLACFAESVISLDVHAHPERDAVLAALPRDIRDRIAPVVVPDNDAKVLLVGQLNFEFAFVDAGHTVGQVRIDYNITRRCGEMLFHDYPNSGSGCNGVGLVLDAEGERDGVVERCQPFAWWRARQ